MGAVKRALNSERFCDGGVMLKPPRDAAAAAQAADGRGDRDDVKALTPRSLYEL